jgi:hypothetical protein
MRVSLRSKASPRSSSNLGRASCSGRGDGARNLGLMTILGGSALESLEGWMTVSSVGLSSFRRNLDHEGLVSVNGR